VGIMPPARDQLNEVYRRSSPNLRHLSQLVAQLQEDVRQARMLPLATLFDPLPRIARDLAQELGKVVALHIEGGDIAVDRSLLEQIKYPLQQLLHNSIDHGLETPDVRRAAGKSATGQISLTAVQHGSSIHIEMSDDGVGFDLARIREQAARQQWLTPEEAAQLDEQAALWLLFQPGFSLAGAVTAVSGRGVGLDIVHQAVEGLHGLITVTNRPGGGASILLNLPVNIASSLCLLIRVGGQVVALPARHVLHLIRLQPGELMGENNRLRLTRPGARPVPAVDLAAVLVGNGRWPGPSTATDCQTAVLIGAPDQAVALLVDELCAVQEIVIKKLPPPIAHMPYIAGAAILGTGAVVLVLSATELIRTAGSAARQN
jgi:two-component system, chemotaxis family, sensor kinase CheA